MKIHSMLSHSMAAFGVLLGVLSHPVYSTWSPPVILNSSDTAPSSLSGPVLVVIPSGNAISVWTTSGSPEFPNTDAEASSFYTPATGWTPSQFISNISANQFGGALYSAQGDPDVVMNSSGYAVAAWEGSYNEDPFPSVIIATVRSTDGTWSPVQHVDTETGNTLAVDVNLAINDAGTTLAAWRVINSDDGTEVTKISFLPFGGSWSTPVTLSLPNEQGIGGDNKPFASLNENGDAVVSWQSRAPGNIYGTSVATYNAATSTWSPPILVDSTAGPSVSLNPRSAIDENGNAVVAWHKSLSASDTNVYASYFNGTSWSAPFNLSSALGPDALNTDPDVIMDAQGNVSVVWGESLGQIWYVSRLPDGTWTLPVAISPVGSNEFFPFMSQNPLSAATNGDMMATWRGDDQVFAAFKPFGSPWLAPELVFGELGSDPIYLNIGLTSCGLAIALWQSGGTGDVLAAINSNMLLPQNARGKKCCDKFAVQKRCLNILKWDASSCALSYNIYRDGVLFATVPPSQAVKFVDTLSCKNKKHSYTISLVNLSGVEGDQVPVVFR